MRRPTILTVLLSIALVCGCTSGGTPGSGPDTTDATDDSSIPQDWEVSEAELMASYQRELKYEAEQLGIDDPPDVELVRLVSLVEWPHAQVDCLGERGYAAYITQGGVGFPDVPAEQGEQLNLAAYICRAEYPVDPRVLMPLPQIRAEMQYKYLTSTVRDCVEELGYSVDDPPSMETWLSDYYAKRATWDPYTAVAEQAGASNVEALNEVYESCPHDAPDLYPPLT